MSQIGGYRPRRSSADIRRENLLIAARDRGQADAEHFTQWMVNRTSAEATYLHRELCDEYVKGFNGSMPDKVIHTVTDLAMLALGSIIRDKEGDVLELRVNNRTESGADRSWCGYETDMIDTTDMRNFLPAVVLYEPVARTQAGDPQ